MIITLNRGFKNQLVEVSETRDSYENESFRDDGWSKRFPNLRMKSAVVDRKFGNRLNQLSSLQDLS